MCACVYVYVLVCTHVELHIGLRANGLYLNPASLSAKQCAQNVARAGKELIKVPASHIHTTTYAHTNVRTCIHAGP